MQRMTLYSREGNSDKQYTIWIEERGEGLFTVEAQWGPRGGHVQSGTKTPKPVPLDQAQRVYDKVIKEKRAKGYHEGKDAPAFSQVEGAEDTGLRPMLLTDATDEGVDRFVNDDRWGAQEKCNGKRIMVRITEEGVFGSNKRGLRCPIPEDVAKALRVGPAIADGEMIGDVYAVFDLVENSDCANRSRAAQIMVEAASSSHVRLVPLVTGRAAKRALVEKLKKGRKEGVVFKMLAAAYTPGKIENVDKSVAVKVKFYKEMDCVVIRWTEKSSIEVGAFDGEKLVSVGKVTVPAKYAGQIKQDGVVRVRYLFGTTPGRQLFQAVLDPDDSGEVMSTDVAPKECLISNMQFEGKDE